MIRTMVPASWHSQPLRRLDRREAATAALLALLAWLVYNANLRPIATGDSYPARFIPFALLAEGTLRLDPVLDAVVAGHPTPYWVREDREGATVSLYPIVTPVLVTPLYVPAFLYLESIGWDAWRLSMIGLVMEKLAAATVAATAAALLFLAVRRRARRGEALVLFAAFAFGTNAWVTSSQALWQHGMAQLLLALLLLLATGPAARWRLLVAGIACGLVVGNRPPDLFLAAAFAMYAPFWAGRRSILFYLGTAAAGAAVLAYNLDAFGTAAGGYGAIATPGHFGLPVGRGLAGLLFSPGKGLFVFSSFLLFLPLFARRSLAPRSTGVLTVLLFAGIAAQLLFYSQVDWRGGTSYGPRFLSDMQPLLVWTLAPVLASLRGLVRTAFLVSAFLSMMLQAIGAFYYRGPSDDVLNANWSALWDPRAAPYVVEVRQGLAPMIFLGLAGVPEELTYPGEWPRRWSLR